MTPASNCRRARGTDSIHATSEYCLAVTLLSTQNGPQGSGFVLTLGEGNQLVCRAIELLAEPLVGMSIESLEHIPHPRNHFLHPAQVSNGVYQTPQEPGASTDLKANGA